MPESREEVVNGEIRVPRLPTWSYKEVVIKLRDLIGSQVDGREVGVTTAEFSLMIQHHDLTGNDGRIHTAPQLVIEVLSPSDTRRDREPKVADHASLGVPEAWIVSPEGMTVEVLYLEEGRLRCAQILMEGILTPKHFPTVKVDIAAIWPE